MPRHFLSYWKFDTAVREEGKIINHSASGQFSNIANGDTLWINTYSQSTMYLVGYLIVDRVVDQETASQILHERNLWQAEYHAIATPGTEVLARLIELPRQILEKMRFQNSTNSVLAITEDKFDPQQLRALRELTPASAELLKGFYIEYEQNGDNLKLNKYENYSRKMVHDIFSPGTKFIPRGGPWGASGIVPLRNNTNDFVFFVTLGQQQGEHIFDEGITNNGVLTWQSQPRQSLNTSQIVQLIHHDELKNNIYLFFRTSRDRDYTYLGKLKYLSHDKEREYPVYFQWQILDWEPGDIPEKIGLKLLYTNPHSTQVESKKRDILELEPPPQKIFRSGINTPTFKAKKNGDYSEKDNRNKELGLLGENLVKKMEFEMLMRHGKQELAQKIRHVSKLLGDGAGYDIESYSVDGTTKYIEVKTTTGSITTSFFMSSNERAFAERNKNNYYIYRVYDYDKETNTGKYFIMHGSLEEKLVFSPTQFRVSFVEEVE